jgi:hypothetical protein
MSSYILRLPMFYSFPFMLALFQLHSLFHSFFPLYFILLLFFSTPYSYLLWIFLTHFIYCRVSLIKSSNSTLQIFYDKCNKEDKRVQQRKDACKTPNIADVQRVCINGTQPTSAALYLDTLMRFCSAAGLSLTLCE